MTQVPATKADQIIDEAKIYQALDAAHAPSDTEFDEILAKAKTLVGLNIAEAAVLLQAGESQLQRLYDAAGEVKELIYGKRMVLFAPLYTSNTCINDCLYCNFRMSNKELHRKTLSQEEIARETRALIKQGHKRVLMVLGEDSRVPLSEMAKSLETVYSVKEGKGEIRRVNVNAAPMEPEAFRMLKEAGIGTYQCFQETYHRETYKKMHPRGPKSNYDYRVTVFDRSIAGGIDDFGLGALFGLADPRFEVMALLQHAAYLDSHYGAGPHTISFPRLEPAPGAPLASDPPFKMNDHDVKVIVAVLRLAVPYTGIIMSTRENASMRRELIHLGVSQLSAGSSTSPGGYFEREDAEDAPQFITGDHRGLDEIIRELAENGYMPSFCTGCYRKGRTGHDFMDMAKPGLIQQFCLPNGILTFKEFLLDYASPATKVAGDAAIAAALIAMDPKTAVWTREQLIKIESGERDIYQ
jgi:2-iminoacetate synthase